MTMGNDIEYAIFKSVSEYGLDVWLETWEISRADWDKFITAGKSAFSDTPVAAEIIHCRDCKHSNMTYRGECKYCDTWSEIYDSGESLYLDGDFYCGLAERKEDA